MRGRSDQSDELFSFVRLEERVPADHPLRAIRALTDEVLASLSDRLEGLYARVGRHADRRLGEHEELPAQGRLGRSTAAGTQWRA